MAEDTKGPPKQVPARDEKGRLLPGNTANPLGLRKRIPEAVREMWEAATPKATQRLVEMLDATKSVVVSDGATRGAHIEEVADWDTRHKAICTLYERQWGKPSQAITGEDGEPMKVDIGLLGVLRGIAEAGDK